MEHTFVIHLVLLLLTLATVNGHYGYVLKTCRVLGSLQNIELIFSVYYDKAELLKFNSTENKVVAYTEYAMKWADDFNKKPDWLHKEAEKVIADCKHFGQQYIPLIEKTVKPEVIIRSVKEASGEQPAVLICSAYGFYPKAIKVTWMRDDEEVTADVTSTEEMADGDWFYQIHSHLEYFPKPGEKISCVVDHASSNRPMIYDWESSQSESERNKMITGVAGVVLGVIMAAGGLIYYKRKHTAHVISAGTGRLNFRRSEPLNALNTEEQ